jgi:hypothetical protein
LVWVIALRQEQVDLRLQLSNKQDSQTKLLH